MIAPSPKTLVIDIGGTSVKLSLDGKDTRRFVSGRWLTPERFVTQVRKHTENWRFERVSIGYPGKVSFGKPLHEPWNLGDGWTTFDFAAVLGCPIRLVNDAAMQALGNYETGSMLFVGFGTSIGGALIVDGVVFSLEPGSLGHPFGGTLEEHVNAKALRSSRSSWRRAALACLTGLKNAFAVDLVVVGGGNAKYLRKLPEDCQRGSDDAPHEGGLRLWNSTLGRSLFITDSSEDCLLGESLSERPLLVPHYRLSQHDNPLLS